MSNINIEISLWKILREQILNFFNNYDNIDKFYIIPNSLSNNMIWIFGHIIRTRNFLLLQLAEKKSKFPEEWDPFFSKGSSPKDWIYRDKYIAINHKEYEKDNLLRQFMEFEKENFDFLVSYILENINQNYHNPYKTSTGYVIDSIKSALSYNIIHESIHLGQLQLYNKLI